MKKVKLYEEYFNEAKFTEYDNNELAAYVKNNPKDKEAAKELHKRSQKLKSLTRTDESSILENDATAAQQLADEVSGELYTAKLKGKSATIKATTTTKTWDDGVPVLKYLARGKAQPVKFELWQRAIDIVHDVARGWFYFTDGRKWYGLHGDEGYLEPSDLPFDMELTESVNEGKEEDEARAILQDLLDEFDPWDLSNMLQPDAEETVAAYGHKGKKAEKIATALLSMAQNGEFESLKEASDMNDPVLMAFRAAKMNREKQLAMAKPKRKPLYGKQREKAEDNLWQISQDLKDLYADRGQMLIDMEQEAETEGGPIADEYGDKLNKIEDQIQKLISKRNKLEMMLAENYNEDDINMTYGFYGTVTDNSNENNAKKLFDQGIKDLKKKYRLTEEEALAVLNSKMGRKAADQIYDGQAKTAVEGLETYYGKTLHRELAEIQKSMVFDSVITESHFKVGDKVKMSHGGTGIIVSLDKEDGTEDQKYYNVELPTGEIHKHSPKELTKESVVTEGKTSAVYTDPKTGKGYDLQYVSSKKRWELDVMKKGASIYSNAITTIKRNTLAEIQEWLDGYKIDSSWTKGLSESVITEAKTLDRDEMMIWLEDHLEFVSTSEEFNGSPGGIWISGENGDQYKGKRIYDYYSEDYKNREFGVLTKWEKELNKRGWYSEWYDAGTVMIWPN